MKKNLKKKPIRRTRHFKKKNPMTFKRLLPLLKTSLKVAALLALVLSSDFLFNKVYQRLEKVSYFHVRKMVFRGCENSKEKDLYKISSVTNTSSMLSLDLNKVAWNIEKHPWVKKVSIKKQLPEKLLVGIKEREPVAMLNLDNLYYVDAEGVVFKKVESGDDTDYLVITGLSEKDAFSKKDEDKRLLVKSIELINMLKERDTFSDRDVSEMNLDENNGITLFTYDNAMPIKIGFDFSNKRFDKLLRVMKELKEKSLKAEYIDIDYDERIVVKIATSA